jgi:hypothetical protein
LTLGQVPRLFRLFSFIFQLLFFTITGGREMRGTPEVPLFLGVK